MIKEMIETISLMGGGGGGGEDGGWEGAVRTKGVLEMGEAEELEWRGVGWERGVVGGGRTGARKGWRWWGEGVECAW